MARAERRLQPAQHGVHVDRLIGLGPRSGGRSPPSPARLPAPHRERRYPAEVVVDRTSGRSVCEAAEGSGSDPVDNGSSARVDSRHPRGCASLPTRPRAPRALPPRRAGTAALRSRSAVRRSGIVDVFDRGEEGDGFVDRHAARRRAAPRSRPFAHEQVPVAASPSLRSTSTERSGVGDHRVPAQQLCETRPRTPRPRQNCRIRSRGTSHHHLRCRRQVRHALGQVAVRRSVGEQRRSWATLPK